MASQATTTGPGRRELRLIRLATLAGFTTSVDSRPPLSRPAEASITAEDLQKVQLTLEEARQQDRELGSIFKRLTRPSFSPREATLALQKLVFAGCTAGQARYLIQNLNATLNPNDASSETPPQTASASRQPADQTNEKLLIHVVKHGDASLFTELCRIAGVRSCTQVLPLALMTEDIQKIAVLMAESADINAHPECFMERVNKQDEKLVALLINGSCQLSPQNATRALYPMVQAGYARIVDKLLQREADTNAENASAFHHAVKSRNIKILAALCSAKNHPLPEHLAKGIATICASPGSVSEQDLQIIELLLAAGAEGVEVHKCLLLSTQRKDFALTQLLLGYLCFDDRYTPKLLRAAVKKCDLVSFMELMKIVDSTRVTCLDSLLEVVQNFGLINLTTTTLKMTVAVLEKGPSREAINKLFYHAVEQCERFRDNRYLMEILLDAGADANTESGACFSMSVAHTNSEAFQILMARRTPDVKLEPLFTSSMEIQDHGTRYFVMGMLIEAGVRGTVVTMALVDLLDKAPKEYEFSHLFASKGEPNVNLMEGRVVIQAITHHEIDLLRMLMKRKPSLDVLNNGLRACMASTQRQYRLEMCKILLEAGAKGAVIDDALIYATIASPEEPDLVQLFISKDASIDHKAGMALNACICKPSVTLLKVLVQAPALTETLLRAMHQVLSLDPSDQKTALFTCLLEAKTKLSTIELQSFVPKVMSKIDLEVLALLITRGAVLESECFDILKKVVDSKNKPLLKTLLEGKPPDDSISKILDYVWAQRKVIGLDILKIVAEVPRRYSIDYEDCLIELIEETPCSIPLINLILNLAGSVACYGGSYIRLATGRLNIQLLSTLLEHANRTSDSVFVTTAFEYSILERSVWEEADGLECLRIFLSYNVSSQSQSEVLIAVTEKYGLSLNAVAGIGMLLASEADPNYNDAEALGIAITSANLTLVQRLLEAQPTADLIDKSFRKIFQSTNAQKILDLISVFIKVLGSQLNVNDESSDEFPAWVLSLHSANRNADVVSSLLKAGANADLAAAWKIDENTTDLCTPLMYMTSNCNQTSDTAIINLLVDSGANVNYVMPTSRMTPLLAAAKSSNFQIVELLLSKGANISDVDCDGRSALCHATRTGNIDLLRLLLQSHARPDDGSLHEAVQTGNYEVASLLLDHQHHPNFPSPVHDFQGALQVALRQHNLDERPQDLKQMFSLLLEKGASPTYRRGGKALIFLALDLPNADKVLSPLLNSFVGGMLNDDISLYHEDELVFSPLSYLIQNKQKSPKNQKAKLMTQLEYFGCREVYYHETGPQPAGWRNAPPELARRQHQLGEEEQHSARLRRMQEESNLRIKLLEQEHRMKREMDRIQMMQEMEMEEERFKQQETRFNENSAKLLEWKRNLRTEDEALIASRFAGEEELNRMIVKSLKKRDEYEKKFIKVETKFSENQSKTTAGVETGRPVRRGGFVEETLGTLGDKEYRSRDDRDRVRTPKEQRAQTIHEPLHRVDLAARIKKRSLIGDKLGYNAKG